MKRINPHPNLSPRGRGVITRLTFLVLLVTLSGCAAKTVNVYLEDKPTKLDQNFRQSVEQMIEVQRYNPETYTGTKAGNHLEGWEADTILNKYQNQ